MLFWNNLHKVIYKYQNIEKVNNLKVFGSNKTKGLKQHNQNQLRSPMPERRAS